jgi:hypothetical protein
MQKGPVLSPSPPPYLVLRVQRRQLRRDARLPRPQPLLVIQLLGGGGGGREPVWFSAAYVGGPRLCAVPGYRRICKALLKGCVGRGSRVWRQRRGRRFAVEGETQSLAGQGADAALLHTCSEPPTALSVPPPPPRACSFFSASSASYFWRSASAAAAARSVPSLSFSWGDWGGNGEGTGPGLQQGSDPKQPDFRTPTVFGTTGVQLLTRGW